MEQRLIDADALQAKCERNRLNFVPIEFLKNAPTVDAVPVTRCIDCKHSMKVEGMIGLVWCDHLAEVGAWVENDFYCADGERRSDD